MMGVGVHGAGAPAGRPIAQSLFVPDAVINPHQRFGALTRNIRSRRGERVDIRLLRFRDAKTPAAARPAAGRRRRRRKRRWDGGGVHGRDGLRDGVLLPAVTFQARDVSESRHPTISSLCSRPS